MESATHSSTMDTNTSDCVKIDEEETIPDSFICCVCLDLLYKPTVLECGHVSCFWCVHKSMDGLRESHCPICRNPYHHFPTICEKLHFLLLKMYPYVYKRRERQILEEEKRMGFFSPQLDNNDLNGGDGSKISHKAKADDNCLAVMEENSMSIVDYDRTCDEFSRLDVLCPVCKQLLFRPAVLNCGHVFCQFCVIVPEDGVNICSICESPHPIEVPCVCLEFNNFLEEKFPEEYAVRRKNVENKQFQFLSKISSECCSSKKSSKKNRSFLASEDFIPWWNEVGSKVHIEVGCDYCGMYPLVGDRYRCQDCVERIGFDLCGDCYNTSSKRPGRFNQQHTPDHRFELVNHPNVLRNIMDRLLGARRRVESYGAPVLAITAGDNSEDNSVAIESSDAPQLVSDGDEGDSMLVYYTDDGPIPMEFIDSPEVLPGNDSASADQDENNS